MLRSHDQPLRTASELPLTDVIKQLRSLAKDHGNNLFEFDREVLLRAADALKQQRTDQL